MSTCVRLARIASVALLAAGLTLAEAPVLAQEPLPQLPRPETTTKDATENPLNIRFEITATYASKSGGDNTRSAILTVRTGSSGSFRAGNEVPVPSTTFAPVTAADGAQTAQVAQVSYSYKAIGLNVDVERVAVDSQNRVWASIKVDTTGVDTKSYPRASFSAFRQTFSLMLDSGSPIEVVRSRDAANGVMTEQAITVKATILK